jgi:hypothetical protein
MWMLINVAIDLGLGDGIFLLTAATFDPLESQTPVVASTCLFANVCLRIANVLLLILLGAGRSQGRSSKIYTETFAPNRNGAIFR